MKVGIPRALLYYKNEKLWTTFFDEIGVEYIISPETNKEIIKRGSQLAIDEACLPTKIMLGHIDWLIDKCDMIFVPRVYACHGYFMCTKFLAIYDLVNNTFRDKKINILFYNVKDRKPHRQRKGFYKMGKFLKVKKSQVKFAYIMAKQAQLYFEMFRSQDQEKLLAETKKNKVLVVAHAYNIKDKYVGEPIINALKRLDCEPIIAEYAPEMPAIHASLNVSKTMPWGYNKHLLGAIEMYKDQIDGIVLLTTFPCGPDSMADEMIIRSFKDKPILTLTIDAQDATAGIETRLESYVDILNFRKEKGNE